MCALQADRPWDSPLTLIGHKQGVALGHGIKEQLKAHNLPPVYDASASAAQSCLVWWPFTCSGTEPLAVPAHRAPPLLHATANRTRIYSSPMLRCAQTAAAADSELGVGQLRIDPSLSETICENWYRYCTERCAASHKVRERAGARMCVSVRLCFFVSLLCVSLVSLFPPASLFFLAGVPTCTCTLSDMAHPHARVVAV